MAWHREHCPQTVTGLPQSQLAEDAEGDRLERGTRVTLHLKDDAAEYAGDKKLGALIKQYSEFIAFPIKLWAEKCVPCLATFCSAFGPPSEAEA